MMPAEPASAAHAIADPEGSGSPRISANGMSSARATACETSRTASAARRRLWRPPKKSASPQHSDELMPSATASSSVSFAAPVQQLDALQEHARGAGLVREHVHVALGRQPRDQQRLLAAVLADAARAVALPHPRRLPAAHRQLERDVVDLRVVDAHDARLDPA